MAERWRSERWDSLRLLTPNWMTRLPGWTYRGPEPDGFMTAPEFADHLRATRVPSPHRWSATHPSGRSNGFRTGSASSPARGEWVARNVVIATGFADRPAVPAFAAELRCRTSSSRSRPTGYRNPRAARRRRRPRGRRARPPVSSWRPSCVAPDVPVHLAVGCHTRMPRRYRGADIWWWFDRFGIVDDPVDGRDRARICSEPSAQLSGANGGETIGLASLASLGVTMSGRLVAVDGPRVYFGDNLEDTCRRGRCASCRSARPDRSRDRRRRRARAPTGAVRADTGDRRPVASSTCERPGSGRWCGPPVTVATIAGCKCRCWTVPASSCSTKGATPVPGLYASACGGSPDGAPTSSTVSAMTRGSWPGPSLAVRNAGRSTPRRREHAFNPMPRRSIRHVHEEAGGDR